MTVLKDTSTHLICGR